MQRDTIRYLFLLVMCVLASSTLLHAAPKRALMQEDVGMVNPLQYGSSLNATTLAAAVTAIGSDSRILFLSTGSWSLASNVTVPSNITLWVPRGASVVFSGSATLTLNGGLQADYDAWYSGAGTLVVTKQDPAPDALTSFVVSGCTPTVPSSSLTLDAFACTVQLINSTATTTNVVQSDAAVGPLNSGNGTYWIAIHRDTSSSVSGWTRQGSTSYLWQMAASQPATPTDGLLISRVTVAGGVITAVSNMGNPFAIPLTTIADETDVRQDGAECDGSTDDTQAFVRAHSRGKPLRVPVGTCLIDTIPVANGERFVVRGNGVGRSILKHKGSATAPLIQGPATTLAATYIELRDLTLDGNNSNQTDWELDVIDMRADTLLLDNIECKNSKRSCLDLQQVTYVARIQNSWFHDMSVHGGTSGQETFAMIIGKESLAQPGPFDSTVYVQNNRVEMTTAPSGAGNSAGGIFMSPTETFPQRMIITNNTFVRIGQGGAHTNYIGAIDCYRECDNSLIQGNHIHYSYQHAIRVQRSTNVQILDNLISGEQEMDTGGTRAAIAVSNRATATAEQRIIVSRNIIRNLPTNLQCIAIFYNASATPFSDIIVESNICDTTGGGLYFTETSGSLLVRGNIVQTLDETTDFKSSGIAIFNHYGPRILLDGNVLKNIQQRGIYFDDGTPRTVAMTVSNNHIEDVGLTLPGASGRVVIRNVDKLLLKGNVWTEVAAAGALQLFDVATIPYLAIFDNQAPASPSLTYGANAGSTQYKTRGNTWSNDAGTVTLDGTTPTAVAFGTAEKDTSYRVAVTCLSSAPEEVAGAGSYTGPYVTGKATTGFNLQTGGTHSGDCDWVINR